MKCRVVDEKGEPCPTCNKPSQTREHKEVKMKQLRQPYYFTRWFYCTNKSCKTKMFMLDKYKVWNNNDKSRKMKVAEEDRQQLAFIRSI